MCAVERGRGDWRDRVFVCVRVCVPVMLSEGSVSVLLDGPRGPKGLWTGIGVPVGNSPSLLNINFIFPSYSHMI